MRKKNKQNVCLLHKQLLCSFKWTGGDATSVITSSKSKRNKKDTHSVSTKCLILYKAAFVVVVVVVVVLA